MSSTGGSTGLERGRHGGLGGLSSQCFEHMEDR